MLSFINLNIIYVKQLNNNFCAENQKCDRRYDSWILQ